MRRLAKSMTLRSNQDFMRALRRVEALFGAKCGTRAGDELEDLVAAVVAYEDLHHRIQPSTGLRVLRHLIEANGLTAKDLPEIGPRAEVSAILAGKRRLQQRHLRALTRRFRVPPGVFRHRDDEDHVRATKEIES